MAMSWDCGRGSNRLAPFIRFGALFSIVIIGLTAEIGCSGGSGGSAGTTPSASLPSGVKQLQEPEINVVVRTVKGGDFPPAAGEFRISGERRYDMYFLTAERIVFEPNARLVFTKTAYESRPTFFLLAKEVVSLDQEHPGTITWEQPQPSTRDKAGSAAAGVDNGAQEGVRGGDGGPGAAGAIGDEGRPSPALTIAALSIRNPLTVLLPGAKGGTGGQGQDGGRGGGGGHGNPASQSMFDCKRGCGNGAAGGNGGAGGQGGDGGRGGRGGNFTLVVPPDQLPVATRLLKVTVSGGDGGGPGSGGAGGLLGSGGAKGQEAKPYCKDDCNNGPQGVAGGSGGTGQPGHRGPDGDFFVGTLAPDAIQTQLLKLQ